MFFGRRSPHDQRRNQNEKGRDKNRKKVLTKRIKLCIISDVRRQKETAPCDEYTEKYSRGRRGAPAKGVGRLYRRESSNLSFSAKKVLDFQGLFSFSREKSLTNPLRTHKTRFPLLEARRNACFFVFGRR